MKNLIKILTIICISFVAKPCLGAVPTWQVAPSSYTYTMNITAQLNISCANLSDTANILAAFVGGNCRGVVHTSNVIQGNYLAFLTVYSNRYSGDTVSFKMYNASTDSVYSVAYKTLFTDGTAIGSPFVPKKLATDNLPTDISLSKTTVVENLDSAFVGLLSTIDLDTTQHTYQLVSGIGDTNNADFKIVNDSLFTATAISYDKKATRSIRVETSNGICTYQKALLITIKDTNSAPALIELHRDTLNENNAPMATVGTFHTVDFDSLDTHSYSMAIGFGDEDNSSFLLDNDQLKIGITSNFEVKNTYSILVQSDDGDGGKLTQQLSIYIADINDSPTLRDTTIEVIENHSINSDVASLNFSDEDQGDTHSFTILQPSPFSFKGKALQLTSSLDYKRKKYYNLTVVIADGAGLTDTAEVTIIVTDASQTKLPVNKVISPNGDGINDFFAIQSVELYKEYSLRIYNGSGLMVYEKTSDYDNSWAGDYNGKTLDSDVYYYLFQNSKNAESYFKGAISIVK